AGVGGPIMLVPLAILALIVLGLSWFAKRRKLALTTGGGETGVADAGGGDARGRETASPATGPIPVATAPTAANAESLTVDPRVDPQADPAADPAAGAGHVSATTGPIPTDLGPAPPHSRGTGE
ncbi:MAG TPA: hypothetical protein VK039_10440, partial [Brevibacterium sp.]|nr:hypothetical protein [Brevibacterium sp.]